MCSRDQVWFIIASLLILAGGLIFAFFAPCGCYASTSVKDVPLRCVQVPDGE